MIVLDILTPAARSFSLIGETATLNASSDALFDEMHRSDPNYTPGLLPPDCEFARIE